MAGTDTRTGHLDVEGMEMTLIDTMPQHRTHARPMTIEPRVVRGRSTPVQGRPLQSRSVQGRRRPATVLSCIPCSPADTTDARGSGRYGPTTAGSCAASHGQRLVPRGRPPA